MKNSFIIRIIAVFLFLLAVIGMTMVFTSCEASASGGPQWFDTAYRFDRVIAKLPDGTVIDDKVDSWLDFEDGDQLQITVDGDTYLLHSTNVVLIKEG